MREDKSFQNSNFAEVFGELEKVYRIRRGCFENVFIPVLLFGCFIFGVLMYTSSGDVWALPVCALPFLILFGAVVWHLLRTNRDELRIYERGFTYQRRRSTQTCLWQQIKSYKTRERNDRESDLTVSDLPLASIEKENGEMLEFDHDVEGTPEIISRWESYKREKKGKSKPKNPRAE